MSKRRTDSHCFAPGCRSGYPGAPKASLFAAPREDDLRRKWERNLRRDDKPLTETSAVCEHHFEPRYILREYVHVINGCEVRTPRGKPSLVPDAVPTLLPGCPAYLSVAAPKQRPERRKAAKPPEGASRKRRRPDAPDEVCDGGEMEGMNFNAATSARLSIEAIRTLEVPANYWCRIEAVGHCDLIFVTTVISKRTKLDIFHEKAVCFMSTEGKIVAQVFYQGVLCQEKPVQSLAEATSVLEEARESPVCKGAMCKQEFKPLSSRLTAHHRAEANTAGRSVISVRCFGKVSSEGSSCAQCKSLRKALLTRKSYINCRVHLPVTKTLSSRLTQQKKKTARLQNQACVLKKKLSVMLAKNVAIAEEDFNAKVALLPEKQREATLHIFKASSRKSTKGMIFSNEWVLECLIMKLKSARLYEHLRKEKILVLPSKTTLRKYLKCYRTGFGFSNKIFDVLKQKTCTMDEFLCHGGLIVDELKLSEHLSVNSEGRIDGFVDLGQFTSDKDEHSVCDHGMVIIFVPFVGKWTQILAAFATHGNINGNLLTKIMLEAVILAEKAGLKVDFITSDGATWNREMWSVMGIKASLTETKCSTLHPVDPTRKLHFLSDFPHLIKCLRNGLLRSDYETLEGRVSLQFVRKALELDGCSVTLQAMHGITGSHTNPNNFEKMRVSLAFRRKSDSWSAAVQVRN
nr:uncharacterized protein LOC119174070 [Rhipicephalus microplus]XP_037280754.1 uncharacterized protein LOC119174070 [Rhipicephalus microplus]